MAGTYRLYLSGVRGGSNTGWFKNTGFGGPEDPITSDEIDSLNGEPAGDPSAIIARANATIHFDLDTTRIVLAGTPSGTYTFAGLPAGFTMTSKIIAGSLYPTPEADGFVRFDDGGLEEFPFIASVGADGPQTVSQPSVSNLNTVNGGVGLRLVASSEDGSEGMSCALLRIEGTFILASWWYSPSLDDWVMGDDPGGDYVGAEHPTPRVDSVSPNSGTIAGGTAFTIAGQGFYGADGEPGVVGVTFDGFAATSVVAVDAATITGITPAHWAGGVGVVVRLT